MSVHLGREPEVTWYVAEGRLHTDGTADHDAVVREQRGPADYGDNKITTLQYRKQRAGLEPDGLTGLRCSDGHPHADDTAHHGGRGHLADVPRRQKDAETILSQLLGVSADDA